MTSAKSKALLDEITELGRCPMRKANPITDEEKTQIQDSKKVRVLTKTGNAIS